MAGWTALAWTVLACLTGFAALMPARAADGRDSAPPPPQTFPAAQAEDPPAQRWSPRVRGQDLPSPPVPSLSAAQVLPFLRGLLIVEPEALARAARIVGGRAGRALIAPGDPVFARGPAGAALTLESLLPGRPLAVLRPAGLLRDPLTGETLGQEARQVAQARLVSDEGSVPGTGPAAVLALSDVREELQAGDLLLPDAAADPQAFVPQVPPAAIRGFVVAVDRRGGVMAGTREGVILGLGRREGLAPGHLLAVHQSRAAPTAPSQGNGAVSPDLPPERTGVLLVVRVHERLSQALVLQASDAIRAGDVVFRDAAAVPLQP